MGVKLTPDRGYTERGRERGGERLDNEKQGVEKRRQRE